MVGVAAVREAPTRGGSDVKYRTIVADPPWPIGDFPEWADGKGFIPTPYPTMTLDEIKALPVREWSDNVDHDAHLYLWTTSEFLRDAFDVARSWGFHYSACLVWCKEPRGVGLGGHYASNIEFIFFCKRPKVVSRPRVLAVTTAIADKAEAAGISRRDVDAYMGTSDMGGWWLSRIETRCAIPTNEQWARLKTLIPGLDGLNDEVRALNALKGTGERKPLERIDTRWFRWPRGPHSKKPEAFLDMVERVSPGPYLEVFARRNRLGWHTWGNESLNHVEVTA